MSPEDPRTHGPPPTLSWPGRRAPENDLQRWTVPLTSSWLLQLLESAVSSWNEKRKHTLQGGLGGWAVLCLGPGLTCAPRSAAPALGSAVPAPPAPAAPAPFVPVQT